MSEQQSRYRVEELYRSTDYCATPSINGVPTPLFLAERPVRFESRAKLIEMLQLCLVDANGTIHVVFGPASGTLEAEALPGDTIWRDQEGIRRLQNAQAKNPLHSALPFARVTEKGIEQYVIPLGHSLHEAFQVLSQQIKLSHAKNEIMSQNIVGYQTFRLIGNVLRALDQLHEQLNLIHGDAGQHYHMRNALIDML